MRIGVVVFPGSNCEYDAAAAVTRLGDEAEFVWHTRTDLKGIDGIILPGGFAHGDYLRPGALARFSPVMGAVERFAAAGGPVLGICNGFQVLVEAGMLPGALQKNRGLTFLCQPTTLVVTSTSSVLTRGAKIGEELVVPINHFSGSYTCDDATHARTRRERTDRASLQGQSERLARRHRRRRQRVGQRGGTDAASRARDVDARSAAPTGGCSSRVSSA